MSNYYGGQPNPPYGAAHPGGGGAAQNLQFYPSSYSPGVSGAATPQQAAYGFGGNNAQAGFTSAGFGSPNIAGRMGEAGGLRTGWIAAFSTEGYDGEPPLLEELGINFGHIQKKVCFTNKKECAHRCSSTLTAPDSRCLEPLQAHRSTHHGRL